MRISKLPIVKFTIKTRLLLLGIVNKILAIILLINYNIEGLSAPAPPIVLLKKYSIYIKSFTYIRAIRNEFLASGDIERTWDKSQDIVYCDFSAQMAKAPLITKRMDLRQIIKIAVSSCLKSLFSTPLFSTFNIRRFYRLSVRLTIEYA